MVVQASNFKTGLIIKLDNMLFQVVECQHVNPGKGGAFVRTRLKNMKSGLISEKTFKSNEKFNDIRLEKREMQFLYRDANLFHFMDNETYEQYAIDEKDIGKNTDYLIENMIVNITIYEDKPFNIELPNFVNLKIVESEHGIKGDTASSATKPVKCETGLKVNVPLFINEGDMIKVDTRTGSYVERVKG